MTFLEQSIISLLAFLTTVALMPAYIDYALKKGRYGIDKYKLGSLKIAESGGVIVLVGMLIALIVELHTYAEYSKEILAVTSSILIVAFIGFIDDVFSVSWKTKILLPLLAAPPLIAIRAGVTTMSIPFFGQVDFGIVYALLFVPLAMTGASNAINMVAGFNGLEAGTGIIISGTLASIGYITGREIITILSLPLFFALVGFYLYNKYPARVFPGNVGTYLIGVAIASIVIIGNVESAGVILLGPHIINLAMYFYGYWKRGGAITRKERFGKVNKHGYLEVPHTYYLPFFVASLSTRMTERKTTYALFAIQAIFAIVAIMVVLRSAI